MVPLKIWMWFCNSLGGEWLVTLIHSIDVWVCCECDKCFSSDIRFTDKELQANSRWMLIVIRSSIIIATEYRVDDHCLYTIIGTLDSNWTSLVFNLFIKLKLIVKHASNRSSIKNWIEHFFYATPVMHLVLIHESHFGKINCTLTCHELLRKLLLKVKCKLNVCANSKVTFEKGKYLMNFIVLPAQSWSS